MVYFKLFLMAVLWGGTFIAGKEVSQRVEPFSAAFLRFFIASLTLLPLTFWKEGRLPLLRPVQFFRVAVLGLTGIFLYNLFFFKGLHIMASGRAAVIIATCPAMITIANVLFFNEPLGWKKLTGIFLSFFGAFIVITKGSPFAFVRYGLGIGELYIFICVLSWTLYSILGKVVIRDLSPLCSICYASMMGCLFLFFPAISEGLSQEVFHYSFLTFAGLFYLGFFGTTVGFLWYYEGIKKVGSVQAGLFINFVPVSALILSYLLLGEIVDFSLLIGGLFVCSGIVIVNLSYDESMRLAPIQAQSYDSSLGRDCSK